MEVYIIPTFNYSFKIVGNGLNTTFCANLLANDVSPFVSTWQSHYRWDQTWKYNISQRKRDSSCACDTRGVIDSYNNQLQQGYYDRLIFTQRHLGSWIEPKTTSVLFLCTRTLCASRYAPSCGAGVHLLSKPGGFLATIPTVFGTVRPALWSCLKEFRHQIPNFVT